MNDVDFDFENSIVVNNGDVNVLYENSQHIQNIKIEIVTNEGDLFYNEEFGFSLEEFLHRKIDDMLLLEIKQRILLKLSKREYVDNGSIKMDFNVIDEKLNIKISFNINSELVNIEIVMDRLRVEVI